MDRSPMMPTPIWPPTAVTLVVDCGPLTSPLNGQVDTSSGTTYNQVATYNCSEGYKLVGDMTRNCAADQMWTSSAPSCVTVVGTVSGSPVAGQSFSLTCSVTGADPLSPTISYQWYRGQSLLNRSSLLSFDTLFLSDAGQYRCEATVRLGEQVVVVHDSYDLQFQSLNIQLRLRVSSNCGLYMNSETDEKTTDITSELTQGVNGLCECGFENISRPFIRCFDDSPQYVTYRAVLRGTPTLSTVELVSLIQQWMDMTEIIIVQSAALRVNSTCPLVIVDQDSPECPLQDLTNRSSPVVTETMPTVTSLSSQPNIGPVVGGVIGGGGGLVAVVLLISVVVVLSVRHHRSGSRDMKTSLESKKSDKSVSLGDLPLAPPTNCPRDYEAVRKYQDDTTYEQVDQPHPPTGDYQLTTCPAYAPVDVEN